MHDWDAGLPGRLSPDPPSSLDDSPPPTLTPSTSHILRFCKTLAALSQARPGKHFGTSKQGWLPSIPLGTGQRNPKAIFQTHRPWEAHRVRFWMDRFNKNNELQNKTQTWLFRASQKFLRTMKKWTCTCPPKNAGQVPIFAQFAPPPAGWFLMKMTHFFIRAYRLP